jgi:3-dehydroquinate synthase
VGEAVTPRSIRVAVEQDPYDVLVGTGLLGDLPRLLARLTGSRCAVLVTDTWLRSRHAEDAARALSGAGWHVDVTALPRGERAKSLEALERLYAFLLRRKVERSTLLVAIGGGTVGDAAGFAAATYHRGIPLVHVPTTLLSQVDSAIGGKTAVNHRLAKNAIGSFYQPRLVVADRAVLATLPRRQVLSGMAEVVKYALALDTDFARWLGGSWDRVLAQEAAAIDRVVGTCVAWKAGIVAEDERERRGRREILNFGHTLGHALETAAGHVRLLHGEAVAWGMRVAIALSEGRGWLGSGGGRLARSLLARLPAPVPLRGADRRKLLPALRLDKKAQGAKNVFVLLRNLGEPVRAEDVTLRELGAAARRVGFSIPEPRS